jgi:malate dehydrogenase
MKRTKISLVGAGQIGGTMALLAAQKQLGDVLLLDIAEGVPQGKALDLLHGGPIIPTSSALSGSNNYADLKDSDVVIVTAGLPRKPGMSRDDLLDVNFGIIKTVGEAIKKNAPNAFVIVVTNPLDAMVYAMQKVTGFPAHRVAGMAGVLDSARFAALVAEALNVSNEDVRALVMGGHGRTPAPAFIILFSPASWIRPRRCCSFTRFTAMRWTAACWGCRWARWWSRATGSTHWRSGVW